jgi:hypothetical protein
MKKTILVVIFVFCLIGLGSITINSTQELFYLISNTADAEGLIGYWGFNYGDASDESENGYNGKSVGVDFIDGIFGLGCEIQGTDRIESIPKSFDDSINNQFTFSTWVYLYEGFLDKALYIFDCREDSWDGGGFIFAISTNNVAYFELRETGEKQFIKSSDGIFVETWTHIAVVFNNDAGHFKVYINGVENNVSTTYKQYSKTYYDAVIGNNHWGYIDGEWRPLNGIVDEIRIYNRALDEDEIQNLYENPSGFHKSFLFGKISDIGSAGIIITFKAVNLHYINTNPFVHKRYFLGETFRITDDYRGYLSGAFVFALVNTDI